MPVLIVLLVIILLCELFVLRRERPEIAYNRMRESDEEALGQLLTDECRRMRIYGEGKGIKPVFLISAVKKANRMINAKIRREEPLSEGEKWFYENYYLVYRYVYSPKDDLKTLPHVDGRPRIVRIAELIVNNSLNNLSETAVRNILERIKTTVNLTYAELKEFNNALSFAVLEQIYILAKRLIKQDFYRKKAYKVGFREKYLKSDVYTFYLYRTGTVVGTTREKLSRMGIGEKNALINFNGITAYNASMAKTLFACLRKINDYVPMHLGLKYLASYRILSEKFDPEKLSLQTRLAYFEKLEKISESTKVNEAYAAEKLLEYSDRTDVDVSVILFDGARGLKKFIKSGKITSKKVFNGKGRQLLYVMTILIPAVVASVLSGVYISPVIGVTSFIPFVLIAENIINYLLSHGTDDFKTPKLHFEKVPSEHGIMIVVSEFISGIDHFKESIRHLEELSASNGEENVQVVMLADIKGGATPFSETDKEILEFLSEYRSEEKINVFIRKKTLINGKYQGKERKRGAIDALNKLLVTGNEEDFSYIYDRNYAIPEYIVTLDADNRLLPGEAAEMAAMMAHPYNKKYDLLAFHGKYDLYSMKTAYSARFSAEAGCEVYPIFTTLFVKLFRKDVYCGKGIYRLNNFYNKTSQVFPSGKILSHDIIEGSVTATGGGSTVFEDAPTGFLSDRERRKRWLRGDVQLLPFVDGRWKNDSSEKVKTDIEPLYKYIMVKNAFSAFKEFCLLFLLIFSLISGNVNALIFASAIFVAPYVVNEIKILRGVSVGVLPCYLIKDTVKNLFLAVEDFFMLGYYAFDNVVTFFTTLGRMAKGKKLLEWKTYYSSQTATEKRSYAREFTPTTVFLTVISLLWLFFDIKALFLCAYTLITPLIYIELYALSSLKYEKTALSERKKADLMRYAQKTYGFFSHMSSEGALIADNLQIKPYKGSASTTSPTNIGLSLIAEICGYKLGFSTINEAVHNLNKILDEVKQLPAWKGNLYNWYDLKTKKQVSEFVSSVDSGNFLVCLYAVKEFFKENFEKIGELKADLMITNTDLKALYDENEKLFFIGYDGNKYVGHYDLLNSEARILSTLYIARYRDTEHFRCLQRDYSSIGGNMLLSWSGTAFEALMPDIFFPTPHKSIFGNTSFHTAKVQSENKYCSLWGISESGYYAFDEELRYQYHAFGINKLALRNEKDVAVVSPYASALCINELPDKVWANLINAEESGMLDEYGFYESIDCEGKQRIVASYMAHHQGMLLASLTNYLTDNSIQKLICNNLKLSSVLTIFNENIPKVAFGLKNSEKRKNMPVMKDDYYKITTKIEQYFQSGVLSDTQYSVILNSFGSGFSKFYDIYINKFFGVYEENDGAFFMVKNDGKWASPTYLPFGGNTENFVFSVSRLEIVHENLRQGLKQAVTLLDGMSGEVRKLTLSKGGEVCYYSSVALNTLNGFRSHPAFNGLFVETYLKDGFLLLRRRKTESEEKDFYLGVKVTGVSDLRWETNEGNFSGRTNDLSKARILYDGNKDYPSLGDVLNPCIGFRGFAERECQVATVFSDDEAECLDALKSLPDDMYSYALNFTHKNVIDKYTGDVLSELLYVPYRCDVLHELDISGKKDLFAEKTAYLKLLVYYFNESGAGFTDFLKVALDLNVLRQDVCYAVVVKKGLPESVKAHVESHLKAFLVRNFVIVEENYPLLKYAFLTFNSDMTFTRTKFTFGKHFLLKKEESVSDNVFTVDSDLHGKELFRSGKGGFDENDDYITDGNYSGLPYADVICAENGGMVVTDNGGGFYYFGNSRENKMTRFDNDCIKDGSGEYFYLKYAGNLYRLSGRTKDAYSSFGRGEYVYVRKNDAFSVIMKYNTLCEGRARLVSADVSVSDNAPFEFVYGFFPVLSWTYEPDFLYFKQEGDLITVHNLKNGQILYVRILVSRPENLALTNSKDRQPYFEYFGEGKEKIYILSTQDYGILHSVTPENASLLAERDKLNLTQETAFDIASGIRSFNILARYLPYQILSSRIYGKTGFYQVGGATGFRDQLQDVTAFMQSRPELVRKQILYSAARQYVEGDVMHWWHHPKFGLRSRITDDKLFLPLVASEYASFTGDKKIFEEIIPYLESPVLRNGEKSRFENPPYSEKRGTLSEHCVAAIKSALSYGKHGLLVMGSGDWNDGMDYVCAEGKGESVFNSMLAYYVIKKFIPFCPDKAAELDRIAEELKTSINVFAFEGDRYKRLYTDDGRWLGGKNCESLSLDLLVQSFAVISGIAEGERAETVLDVCRSLIDEKAGIIRLLDPPSDKKDYLGYISAYPKGVRENGGQYTHAAMWYLIALTLKGRQDEAFKLFQMINPVEKCRTEEKSAMYMGEPFVLSGDVYSNQDNYGRMGWSWYTGSAAWAYRLITEFFFGIRRQGEYLSIKPNLPKALDGSIVTYRFEDSVYIIEFRIGKENRLTVDGREQNSFRFRPEKNKREKILVETVSEGISGE